MTTASERLAAAGNRRLIILRILSVTTALVFIATGGAKLAGVPAMVQHFDNVGVGQWLRYVTGFLELTAGIGLLIPRYAFYAAVTLAVVMIGAIIAQLTVLAGAVGAPLALLVFVGVIGYLRRPQLLTAGGHQVRR